MKGDKYARQLVLEIFGYCGVLQPASQPKVLERWITEIPKDLHSSYYKNDWKYPLPWWTGADGVNEEAVEFWFPGLSR